LSSDIISILPRHLAALHASSANFGQVNIKVSLHIAIYMHSIWLARLGATDLFALAKNHLTASSNTNPQFRQLAFL
jgi:hypothetical protein